MKGSKPKCQLVDDDCLNDLKGEILYLIDTDERLSKFLTDDKRAR